MIIQLKKYLTNNILGSLIRSYWLKPASLVKKKIDVSGVFIFLSPAASEVGNIGNKVDF